MQPATNGGRRLDPAREHPAAGLRLGSAHRGDPGPAARVHDAYIAGEGILHASLFGLVSVANLRGTPRDGAGELLRCFAEAAWYPTALLPSQGMQWEAVDDTRRHGDAAGWREPPRHCCSASTRTT